MTSGPVPNASLTLTPSGVALTVSQWYIQTVSPCASAVRLWWTEQRPVGSGGVNEEFPPHFQSVLVTGGESGIQTLVPHQQGQFQLATTLVCGTDVVLIPGCTNPSAINYNPAANVDDGSCQYAGCTNPAALNYNPNAAVDDGSCLFGNDPQSYTASCPEGTTGDPVTVTISANTYTASSKAAANAAALAAAQSQAEGALSCDDEDCEVPDEETLWGMFNSGGGDEVHNQVDEPGEGESAWPACVRFVVACVDGEGSVVSAVVANSNDKDGHDESEYIDIAAPFITGTPGLQVIAIEFVGSRSRTKIRLSLDVLSSSPVSFGSLPAGDYRVRYTGGSMKFWSGFGYQLGRFAMDTVTRLGPRVQWNGGSGFVGDTGEYATPEDLKAANEGASIAFTHAGGDISMDFVDENYADNVGGPLRFRLIGSAGYTWPTDSYRVLTF